MPFHYYNAHPYNRLVDDCVKRSIALTTGISYKDVKKGLNEHKKITGAKAFNENGTPGSYMENVLGFPRTIAQKRSDGTRETVEEFARSHPKGRYVVSVVGHWTACIDGIIYDTWDCSKERILSYYEVTRFERRLVEKKYCFTLDRESENCVLITVYDGNGIFATKQFAKETALEYVAALYERGFFNFDGMGDYI